MKVILDSGWASVFLIGTIAVIGAIGKLITMIYKMDKDITVMLQDLGPRMKRVEDKVDKVEEKVEKLEKGTWKPVL